MAANRKKYWVIAGLVVLLVLTGYLNYRLNLADIEEEATQEVMGPAPEGAPVGTLVPEETAAMQIEVSAQAQQDSQEALAMASAGYFASYRADRDNYRVQELEVLESIIVSSNTPSEQIEEAQARKLAIVDSMEMEMAIEGLVKAKGFRDAAVVVGNGTVNVVLDKPVLSEIDVAQVLDICLRESGLSAENVKIMPKE